ncbi:hypothetical protein BZA05DRAFT_375515 [Tricharina praecox]|uniref:uncharacterized protein n=1 Tax=Tricharina praecox TaxID=43433 RepID=UPI00221E70B7|nr:uncharacterized protein BZA05DRAFT_375515 [Tricharina praecox]KAI5849233.1 hypothetical protein BZA05DRAFT_375515 [Tricharina praecox]
MQSGSSTDNLVPLPNLSLASPTNNSQYGSGSAVFGGSHPPDGSDVGGSGGGGRGGGALDSAQNGEHTPRSDKANRIARYDVANAVQFTVTRTDWTGKSSSPISRFPNEVLIHVLSFLEPSALLAASLISKRFYAMVNSPDAWRSAFVRFFPLPSAQLDDRVSPSQLASQDRRYFTRLSATDSGGNFWRKEYMQRTRLLRSLSRGKSQGYGVSNKQNGGNLVVTYRSSTGPLSVSHMAANFSEAGVRAVHACLETRFVTDSDPTRGMVLHSAAIPLAPRHIQQYHPDYEVAVDMNVNHVMDLSESLGWIMGENVPDGKCYLQPFDNLNMRDRNPIDPQNADYIQAGNYGHNPSVTCVWIAKKRSGGVRDSTRASAMVGNSRGYLRIFSIEPNKSKFARGETRGSEHIREQIGVYCISPGIPIVQIKVDEDFSPGTAKYVRRPWVAVINALGEIYYLRGKPGNSSIDDWKIIPQTTRIATPMHDDIFFGLGEGLLDKPEEMEQLLLNMEYSRIKCLWEGCRMDWFMEMDWAGGNVITGRTGSQSNLDGALTHKADIPLTSYHLRQAWATKPESFVRDIRSGNPEKQSPFGGCLNGSGSVSPSTELSEDGIETPDQKDDWIATEMRIPGGLFTRITAYSIDNSPISRLAPTEDSMQQQRLPGGSARLFAVGTNNGSIFVFNIRPAANGRPIRIIHTDSPQITTLAVSSLLVVHGGDDGLVQAWDPLGSTSAPVRTLHSRFSARARRRLEQNVGVIIQDNQFAARCLVLDPDPTALRGVVALGTLIRYWSLSTKDFNPGKKGKKVGGVGRRGGTPNWNNGKAGVRDVIVGDSLALQKERELEWRAAEELEKRYGIGIGHAALSEEEMLAYASMVSQETFERESSNRSDVGSSLSGRSSQTITPEGSLRSFSHEEGDDDFQRALRLSLQDVEVSKMEDPGPAEEELWEDPSLFTESTATAGPSNSYPARLPPSLAASPMPRGSPKKGGRVKVPISELAQWSAPIAAHTGDEFEDDLELAIRLSLQEYEQAQAHGKGKGRA